MVVATGGLVLLPGVGSPVGDHTLATLLMGPTEIGLTVKVRLLVAPEAKLPRFVQTTWLPAFVVAAGTALAKAKPAGRLSVTARLAAMDGPKLVTDIT